MKKSLKKSVLFAVLLHICLYPAAYGDVVDLGAIDNNGNLLHIDGIIDAGELDFLSFTLTTDISSGDGSHLYILTSYDSGNYDTEIALYTDDGSFIASDDDDGPGFFSLLSFGDGGNDGAALAAGSYTVVVGHATALFPSDDDITGITPGRFPIEYELAIETGSSLVPIPATIWLFGSGLFGLIGIARRKKS